MGEPCSKELEITAILNGVNEIRDHLIGTYDKPGLIGRVVKLEEAHNALKRIQWMIGGTLLTSIVVAVATWFFKLHS